MKRQFAINLKEYDGQKDNFFAYGAFERVLETARLVDRIEYNCGACMLVFEEDVPDEPSRWVKLARRIGAIARGRRRWLFFRKTPNPRNPVSDTK